MEEFEAIDIDFNNNYNEFLEKELQQIKEKQDKTSEDFNGTSQFFKNVVEELRQQYVKNAKENDEKLEKHKKETEEKIRALTEEKNELAKSCNESKNIAEEYIQQINVLKTEAEKLSNDRNELQQKLEKLQNEIIRLNELIVSSETALTSAKAEIQQLNSQLESVHVIPEEEKQQLQLQEDKEKDLLMDHKLKQEDYQKVQQDFIKKQNDMKEIEKSLNTTRDSKKTMLTNILLNFLEKSGQKVSSVKIDLPDDTESLQPCSSKSFRRAKTRDEETDSVSSFSTMASAKRRRRSESISTVSSSNGRTDNSEKEEEWYNILFDGYIEWYMINDLVFEDVAVFSTEHTRFKWQQHPTLHIDFKRPSDYTKRMKRNSKKTIAKFIQYLEKNSLFSQYNPRMIEIYA